MRNQKPPDLTPIQLASLRALYLADLTDYNEKSLLDHFVGEYTADQTLVENLNVLIAYESVGDYGCDSSSWFLLQNKNTEKIYEVHGSHCSCNGFEGQFNPEETSWTYLLSPKFDISCGGYDTNASHHVAIIRAFLLVLSSRLGTKYISDVI